MSSSCSNSMDSPSSNSTLDSSTICKWATGVVAAVSSVGVRFTVPSTKAGSAVSAMERAAEDASSCVEDCGEKIC